MPLHTPNEDIGSEGNLRGSINLNVSLPIGGDITIIAK
jgi:hypothetical protein